MDVLGDVSVGVVGAGTGDGGAGALYPVGGWSSWWALPVSLVDRLFMVGLVRVTNEPGVRCTTPAFCQGSYAVLLGA